MTVDVLLTVVDNNTPIKVVGSEAIAYGFIRYENKAQITRSIRKCEVDRIDITGVENEFTVYIYEAL